MFALRHPFFGEAAGISERHVTLIECKSVLNRVNAPSMPFHWSINPYRGCSHACVYCYARRYHEWFELNAGPDFERRLFVKINAPQVLRRELSRKSWRREKVAIGTAVDPYQPLEGRYRITRGILEALRDHWTPCSIVTKNTMILRDLDILQELAQGPGCTVMFSVTTVDPELAAKLEPDTPPPAQRLSALRRLRAAGVEAGVMAAPVLPGLTDSRKQLEAVFQAAAFHGAQFCRVGVLRLEGSVRPVYEGFLDREAPYLRPAYAGLYKGAYASPSYQERIERLAAALARRYGLNGRRPQSARRPARLVEPISRPSARPLLQHRLPV